MQIYFSYFCIMVNLQDLKDELAITWVEDDAKLTRKLNSAISIIEKYTNQSLVAKTVTLISNGKPKEFLQTPILNITGAKCVEHKAIGVVLYAKHGEEITIELGVSPYTNLYEAVIRLAVYLFEDREINPLNLPEDVQALVNQFRNDNFIS